MIIRFLHVRVSALIVLPDVLHTLSDSLERKEAQTFGLRLSRQEPRRL